MAIQDYDTLVAAIKSYAARTDSGFSARIPDFVGFAETRIYHGAGEIGDPLFSEPVRSKEMEANAIIELVDGSGVLPDDILSIRRLHRPSDTTGIAYLSPERFDVDNAVHHQGASPTHYTIEGSTLRVNPRHTGTVSLLYFKRHPAISVGNQTGAMLTAHGLLYLEASLIEAFAWMQDVDMVTAHAAKCRSVIRGINNTSMDIRFSGPLRVQARVPLP